MIRLKKIEIHVNEEFTSEKQFEAFKRRATRDICKHLKSKPTVYNTYETRENKLIFNK